MSQGMLDRYPFSQLRSPLWRQLPMAELIEEPLIGVDVDTAAADTGGTALPQRTGLTRLLREVDRGTGMEGNDHLVGAANRAGIPVERKGGLGVAVPVADGPGLAVDGQILRPIPDEIAGQIAAIE